MTIQPSSQYTYSAGVQNLTGVAGDNLVITGAAGTVIRVLRISISSSAAAAQTINCLVIKRSTPDTGGTSSLLAAVPHDSLNPAAAATVLAYTVAPTPGTLVGSLVRSAQTFINTAGGSPGLTEWTFGSNFDQAPALHGTSQQLCVALGNAPTNSPNIGIDIDWTESPV
jgi:GTPase involved in cell partitioning and DNA repair